MSRFHNLEAAIKEKVPGFKIKFKDESILMKIIEKLMFFNKDFKNYTITIGKTVYFQSRKLLEENIEEYFYILSHEAVHVFDYIKHPILFIIGYLFPQIFTILAFFGIFNPYFLLAILFAAPIPAPYRTWAELRGYKMSCKVRFWDGWSPEKIESRIKNRYVNAFIKSAYYFMFPFKSYIISKLLKYKEQSSIDKIIHENI